jgi:processive 1,2-diacylglycerol beta-glucosyltransferase
MKILILSSNNGGGHNSAAKTLLEEAKDRNIECVMVDAMIFFSPKRSERMERIHIGAALHAPYLFNMANRMAMRLEQKTKHNGRVQKRAAEYLKQFVLDNDFDTVIATQVFSAILLTEMKVGVSKKLITCFIATDYCYIPFTAMTNLDLYFLPHKDLIPEYSRQTGERRYLPFGIPVSKQFAPGNCDKDVRTKLKIDPKRKMILVLSGSM